MRYTFACIFLVVVTSAYGDTFRLETHMQGEHLKNNHVWAKGMLRNGVDYCNYWPAAQCDAPKICGSCRVTYLTGAERKARKLTWDEKKQLWRGADGKPYDTQKENKKFHVKVITVTDKNRFDTWGIVPGIWVMSPSGELYTSVEHATGRFHHSSFLAGGLVEGAGLVVFERGKIVHIDNDSGHYKPDRESFKRLLDALHVQDPAVVEYAASSNDSGSPTLIRTEKPKDTNNEAGPAQDIGYLGYLGYQAVPELAPQ
jgi:hypothetical protein